MGASGSKARGLWPFASASGGGGPEAAGAEQSLVRSRARAVPPFVFTRRGSMFYDEDGDLAHEFYEETIVTKNGQKRAKLRRVHKNLIPQGIVKLDPPRIHVDFPVILYESSPPGVEEGLSTTSGTRQHTRAGASSDEDPIPSSTVSSPLQDQSRESTRAPL